MDPSTNENGSAKRTRFDPSAKPPTDTAPTTNSPTAIAVRHIDAHVASLHPEIAHILSTLAKKHLILLTKADHKKRQIERMSDDDELIPRSVRVNFEFKPSKEAAQDPEYTVLNEETATIITQFQLAMKLKIIAVTKIEARLLRRDLLVDLATALRVTTKAFLVCDGTTNPTTVDRMVNTLLDRYHETLLQNCGVTLLAFRQLYLTTHGLTSLPEPYIRPSAPAAYEDDGMTIFARGITRTAPPADAANKNQTAEDKEADTINRALFATFVAVFTVYLDKQKKNAIQLELKKLATEHFESTATTETAMEIDTEASADRPQLENLISTQVDKRTKTMEKEMKSLRAAISKLSTTPKNKPRGSSKSAKAKAKAKTSASPKKTARTSRSPTAPRGRRRRSPVAEAANVTNTGSTTTSAR